MYCKRFYVVAIAAVVSTFVLETTGRTALAEHPAVSRLFAEMTGPDALCRDWEGEDSKRIVAHRDGNSENVIEFITPGGDYGDYTDNDAIVRDGEGNVILDLRSTIWLRMPVVHVTASGVEKVEDIYWLLEDLDGDGEIDLPGSGMTAPTGIDGEVSHFVTIRIAQAAANDLYNSNKFYIAPTGGTRKLCIAVGLFNK